MNSLTPMMQQYLAIKKQYQDAILFFRLGDFYEMFMEDAILASRELEITLTSRESGAERVPMCGVPYHAADSYIARLIDKGYKVAICEQVEDPKSVKGIVKREVIRVITPGTILDEKVLPEKQNNYLVALTSTEECYGLAFVDISTGEFRAASIAKSKGQGPILDEVARLNPAECLVNESVQADENLLAALRKMLRCQVSFPELGCLNFKESYNLLKRHFGTTSLAGFGCEHLPAAITAAALVLRYLQETQKIALKHLTKISSYSIESFMLLDLQTRRNLELLTSLRTQNKNGSLLQILDLTVTAMGGRKLKQWLEQPLLDLDAIKLRLDATAELVENLFLREETRSYLKEIYDLERLLGKVAYGTANARDLLALKHSLQVLEPLKKALKQSNSPGLKAINDELQLYPELTDLLERSIAPEPPLSLKEGGLIKTGYNQTVDQLRQASSDGKVWIASLEQEERERTGVKSLKIGFNKVFGYYLEITKANLNNVPPDYIRKQTLANAERYITPKLKELEDLVLHSQERLATLEYEIFLAIRAEVAKLTGSIQKTAQLIAELDVLCSFAEVAVRNNYVKPEVDNSTTLELIEARHPVVEKLVAECDFVPNNCYLNTAEHQLAIITGPNMAGKSTYIRTVAILAIMAQIGSFIPARRAKIGLVDRVFARVGASDDLATGQSTFMVEMNEVANILNNASQRSLIILDEVGRGTSTFDGLSIAWAISEYLLENTKARTLFATHYHELIELENLFSGVKNYSMAVKEHNDQVIFLRQVVPGGTDKSYGIHVAQLAGLPKKVIERAKEKLHELEQEGCQRQYRREAAAAQETQLSFVPPAYYELIISRLKELDLNNLTPLKALNILDELKRSIKG
ncbi:DNA mismatch repair protein MutS [Zhaonella formicivorans]|uniref:DNA mismatch repair protein MutS n=1 Tax=Zhaonella formicivorans TaxID=2528593 RepID=UPI001D1072F5|nr:DNA mismatch repair protein MutS [Zhaonella formicivorans]